MIVRLTLHRAILGAIGAAILAGLVPAGIALDRRLAAALEDRAHEDLALAPRLFADRVEATGSAMMMHAKDLAHTPGLAEALIAGDRDRAIRIVEAARASLGGGDPVVIGPGEASWTGLVVDRGFIARTQAGEMPVGVQRSGAGISNVALAPVEHDGRWIGAAGLSSPMDSRSAEALAGLTRSNVVVIPTGAVAVASTLDSGTTAAIRRAVEAGDVRGDLPVDIPGPKPLIAVSAPLVGVGTVVFTRYLDDEMAVLPELRRRAAISAVVALALALLLGAMFAARVARPVSQLSAAAAAMATGDFAAPLPRSRIHEVERVATTFDGMRQTLAARLAELASANDALTDRNARLVTLQADLMQRDRLAATGRLVAQLAHEIRNPVASLRNCLELIRRRVEHDPEAREFADLAIDELLRMHELAEQMLDINRPRDPAARRCFPTVVANDVATLASAHSGADGPRITVRGDRSIAAAIAPDALKQVLLNLVQNAREAVNLSRTNGDSARSARIEIAVGRADDAVIVEVHDNGPGVPPDIVSRIFDPFFTTKEAVHGVGLGLFVAEGLVRASGGRIAAGNRSPAERVGSSGTPEPNDGLMDTSGAWFRIELPGMADQASTTETAAST